jgi:hypothetical protein
MRANHLEVGKRKSRHPDLVMGPAQESCKRCQIWLVPFGSQSNANTDHILLGNVALKGPFWESLEKIISVSGILDIPI